MNNTIKQLFERKSVRVYQDKPIEAKEKQLILMQPFRLRLQGI